MSDGRTEWGRMTNAVLVTRILTPADWPVLRETRLRALRDSPHAYMSRYRSEMLWGERQWRARFDDAAWAVAVERFAVVGLAGLVGGKPPEAHHIESMWVAPTHRRRGVSRILVNTMVDLGREAGLDHLMLWVLEDNITAWRAYARLGFVPTGERQPIDPGGRRFERRLRLDIREPKQITSRTASS
jgi:ribosomal protein S18 acetylase RimI-like enzyme